MMRTEDGYIIHKCLNGETEAFGLLVDKYKASIYALAYSKVRNFHDAEDITQEVFIRAFQKLKTLRWWDNFLAWLYAITTNLCKDWIRANSRRPDREFAEDQTPESSVYRSMKSYREDQAIESLNDALDSLPEVYSRVLVLHYLGGMSLKEMAGFLGTSVSTIARRLKEARTQLKGEMLNNMIITYGAQKLQAEFTFLIIETIKRLTFKPAPQISRLTLGLSAATVVIFTILTLSPRPLAVYRNGVFKGSAISSEADFNTVDAELLDVPEPSGQLPARNTKVFRVVESFSDRNIVEANVLTKLKFENVQIENNSSKMKILPIAEFIRAGAFDKSYSRYKFQPKSPYASEMIKTERDLSNPIDKNINSEFIDRRVGIAHQNVKARFIGRLGLGTVNSIAWSPDSKFLAVGTSTGVYTISPTSLKVLSYMEEHSDIVSSVAISPDGKLIASGSYDRTIKLWDVSDGRRLNTLLGHSGEINSVAFSPDGLTVASGSSDKTIKLWNISDGKCIATLNEHRDHINSVAFSPDGSLLASGGSDQTLSLWNMTENKVSRPVGQASLLVMSGKDAQPTKKYNFLDNKKPIITQRGVLGEKFRTIEFSSDGSTIVAGGSGNIIYLLWASNGQIIKTLQSHINGVNSISLSKDGTMIASAGGDKAIRLWKPSSDVPFSRLEGHSGVINSVAFSPDSKMIASGGEDNSIRIWDMSAISAQDCIVSFGVIYPVDVNKLDPDMGVYSVAFSPDNSMIAAGCEDNTVKLWKVPEGENIAILRGHRDDVKIVDFSPNGSLIASLSNDNAIRLWQVSDGQCIKVLMGHIGGTRSLAFSPDSTMMATGGDDNDIKLWSLPNGELMNTLKGHENGVTSIVFSPDGSLMASASRDMTHNRSYIKLWKMPDGKSISTIDDHDTLIYNMAFSPDGSKLISGCIPNIKIWDVNTGDCISIMEGSKSRTARQVAFSPDLSMVALGINNNISLRSLSDGEFIATMTASPYVWYYVPAIDFSSDSSMIATATMRGEIKLWRVPDKGRVKTFGGHTGSIQSIAISPDNSLLASGGTDKRIMLWNALDGRYIANLWGHNGNVNSIAFSPDGSMMASAGDDKSVRLWNPSNNRIIASLSGHGGIVKSVAFSPDNSMIASGGTDREIRLWSISDKKCVAILKGHRDITWTGIKGSVLSVAFSPDGSLLASGSDDKTIKLWKVSNGECVATLKGHDGFVSSVVFSPDGLLIASGSDDKTIKIWRISDGKCIATMSGHKDTVNSVTFNPDGTLIISSSDDKSVRLWDVSEGKLISILNNHSGAVNSIVFSHDGSAVISGSEDGTIGIWGITSD